MKWKVIVGQICLTAVGIVCLIEGIDHDVLFLILGALATSIGYPFQQAKTEA